MSDFNFFISDNYSSARYGHQTEPEGDDLLRSESYDHMSDARLRYSPPPLSIDVRTTINIEPPPYPADHQSNRSSHQSSMHRDRHPRTVSDIEQAVRDMLEGKPSTCANEGLRERQIDYPNGTCAELVEDGKGSVYQFKSADGVTYSRQDPAMEDREAIKARFGGKDPGPEYHVFKVEGGGQGKSNGNNDKFVIARIDERDDNVLVKTIYPVPQATLYRSNGDYRHGYPGGVMTQTKVESDGTRLTVTDYPDSASPSRLTVTRPEDMHPRVFSLTADSKIEEELTSKYYF